MSINSINSNHSSSQIRPNNQDPDAYAQQYANERGISLSEAKAELKAKFGDPKKPEQVDGSLFNSQQVNNAVDFSKNYQNNSDAKTDDNKVDTSKLLSLGFTQDTLSACRDAEIPVEVMLEGLDATMQWIKENYPEALVDSKGTENNSDVSIGELTKYGFSEEELGGLRESNVPVEVIKEGKDAVNNFLNGEHKTETTADSSSSNPMGLNPQEQELYDLGIPVEVIQEGDNAIRNFANENNITLPEK